MAQIQIEKDFLTSSFSILEDQPMDMLLGLDMLKKHQCTIDLRKNCLVIGTTGTETPFLPESELPPCARLSSQVNEEDVIKASAKETAALEDKQLAEAIARSASDSSMDTSESNSEKAGTSGTSTTAAAAPASSSDILPTDTFKEADVANMIAMGFPRASCITELRKNGGDVNLAVAGMFAKSLSESFNKKK
jgi:DNA damage-inducible protein 1